jgi:hypothetical protein
VTASAAEQTARQLRAAEALTRILARPEALDGMLPPATWMVASAGCQVTARFHQTDPAARRAAFNLWAGVLGATVDPHETGQGESVLTGRAADLDDPGVRVVLVAEIWDGAGTPEDPAPRRNP